MTSDAVPPSPDPPTRARLWLITAIMVGFILYGSLWPFAFRAPPNDIGPAEAFLRTWDARPGRGDFLANILLYVPFGGFFAAGVRRRSRLAITLLTVFAGGCLSLSIELTQYYDAGRDTEATDFYANTLGTLVGALAAAVTGAGFIGPLGATVALRPAMLIGAWLAYRLYPYVPTIDLHKYWRALKPIVFGPNVTADDLFRQTAIWLTLCALIDAAVRGGRSTRLILWFGMAVFCAKVAIIDTTVRLAEPEGYVIALLAWIMLRKLPPRARAGIAGTAIGLYVLATRLEPFEFQNEPRPFGWIPFYSFMFGSILVDTLAFLEKFFLYGSLLYLLGVASGERGRAVAVCVALSLLATSWLETYLPGRSAEITDAMMALIIAIVFALLPPDAVTDPPRAASPRHPDAATRSHQQRRRG